MTATTQPGITLEEFTLDDKIEWLQKNADHDPLNILASLIRLREIEGKSGGRVDRGEAVNLAHSLLTGRHDGDYKASVTSKGVKVLCDAILLMDSALLLRGKP